MKFLRLGDSGNDVRSFQILLKKFGYPLSGTGYFGFQTDTAVEDFQRRHGLKVDGIIGDETAKLLRGPIRVSPPTVDPIPLWLSYSLANVGLREVPGPKSNAELVASIKTVAPDYQSDATPWCAGWVSLCLVKGGQKPSSLPLWALSYSDTKNQPVVKLLGPALGAIAVKTRNGGGHVTFVAGRTRGGTLACCGGNQNDMVNVSPYAQSAFLGFYWPKGAVLPKEVGIDRLPIVTNAGQPLKSEA